MRRVVVSFPKSGRTWLRYGLHLAGHDQVPFTHDGFEFNDGARPPLSFDRERRLRAYGGHDRILVVHRDPRDTIVSLYHQITGRFADFFGYQGTISDFIRDPYFGLANVLAFHAMWRDLARHLPVLMVSYEDMYADYAAAFSKATRHLGLPIEEKTLAELAHSTRFEAMREVEQACSFDRPWMQPRLGAPKVRKGRIGGHRDELGATDLAYLEEVIAAFEGSDIWRHGAA